MNMTDNVYEQLINDYVNLRKSSIDFGRIMNFIFLRLPDDEKDLYLWIRKKISLKRLIKLLSKDWVASRYTISDRLIALARHWKEHCEEKVTFT
jgi:hypothetical protein